MTMPITLRSDFSADDLRRLARRSRDANQGRRLLGLAAIHDGARRDEAARIGGVGRQIVRDWVLRFNAEGPDGLIDRKLPGPTPRLNDEQRRALVAIVETGPMPPTPMPCCCSIRPAGISPPPSTCRTTSPCCPCRRNARN